MYCSQDCLATSKYLADKAYEECEAFVADTRRRMTERDAALARGRMLRAAYSDSEESTDGGSGSHEGGGGRPAPEPQRAAPLARPAAVAGAGADGQQVVAPRFSGPAVGAAAAAFRRLELDDSTGGPRAQVAKAAMCQG